MKKTFLAFALLFSVGVSAQQLDPIMAKAYKDAKEKSDKDIANAKLALKPATWMARAQSYQDLAYYKQFNLDSNAADVAIASYKKVIELDQKGGKPGRFAKDAETALKSKTLATATLLQGYEFYTKGNYKKAQPNFEYAATIDPTDTTTSLLHGAAAQMNRDDNNIIKAYEQYLKHGGKDISTYAALYEAYVRKNEDAKGLYYIDQAMKVYPTNKDLSGTKINYYIDRKMYSEALVAYKELIAKDPKSVASYVNVGIIYDQQMGMNDDKISALKKSLNAGKALDDKIAKSGELIKIFTDEKTRIAGLLKKTPKSVDLKKQMNDIDLKIKEETAKLDQLKADKTADSATNLEKAKVQGEIDGYLASRKENKDNAIEWYKKALEIDPNSADGNYNLGVLYLNDAIEVQKPYNDLNPSSEEFKKNGNAMKEAFTARFKEALPYLEKAYGSRKEEQIKNALINIYGLLNQADKVKALMGE
jgi:tetratricopeptide (TPR) repeat protein